MPTPAPIPPIAPVASFTDVETRLEKIEATLPTTASSRRSMLAWIAGGLLLAGGMYALGSHRVGPVDPTPATAAISLPDSLDVPVGKGAVELDVTTKSKTAHVRWIVYPGDAGKLQILGYSDHAQIISLVPGTYWVGADLASADGAAVWCRINAGQGPQPPPDNPISPLQKSLQDAYTVDLDPNKATNTAKLADVLANVVAPAKASGKMVTTADLQHLVKSSVDLAIGPMAIPGVRAAVGAALLPDLGKTPVPVSDAFWTKAAADYAAVATALKGVK